MESMGVFIDLILQATVGPGINSTSNRNEYLGYILRGKGGRCIGLTTLAPACADCLEILEAPTSWSLSRPVMEQFYVILLFTFGINRYTSFSITVICKISPVYVILNCSHIPSLTVI
jgi:hypothetical protein